MAAEAVPSTRQPVDNGYLPKAQCRQRNPSQDLTKLKAALPGGAQTEAQLHGAHLTDLAIPQQSSLNPLAIDRCQRVWRNLRHHSLSHTEVYAQRAFPNCIVFEAHSIRTRPPKVKWKTAGHPFGARLFSGQDVELNHLEYGSMNDDLIVRINWQIQ